jgi:hypothetical protein
VRIRIRNRSLLVINTDRIWSEYSSAANKHFAGSLVHNKVKLLVIFSTYINIYSYKLACALHGGVCVS